jgi:hypothetical protein
MAGDFMVVEMPSSGKWLSSETRSKMVGKHDNWGTASHAEVKLEDITKSARSIFGSKCDSYCSGWSVTISNGTLYSRHSIGPSSIGYVHVSKAFLGFFILAKRILQFVPTLQHSII